MEPGERLGVFEVLGPLGAGGMGEVYRARDTRLGREVALKTLPPSFAGNPPRLARLRHEARILASLNHPHIATLFGLEESKGMTVLVIELVEGQTLHGLLGRGPLHLQAALDLAHQIAEGLEAAHEKGILHRDLKPSNISVDGKGQVKLLDFGLAKAVAASDPGGSEVPTGTSPPSGTGAVVGTGPYMSPEQARGEPVDLRTDIWAFGCVLYEMLTGKRAFGGTTSAEAIAAILESDPDWSLLPETVPPAIGRLLQRCLQKDRERRLRDIGDACLELEDELAPRRGVRPRRDEETPYPGLSPFKEAEANYFFGREQDVRALWGKLQTKTLVAIIGPSGAGKTSLVRAGVVSSRPEGWAAIVSTPGSAPMLRLGQALAPELTGNREALQYLVRFEDLEAAFEALLHWRKHHAQALLVVDQFEELFTLNPPEVQSRFAELLRRIAEAGVHVLLTLRDDFRMRQHDHAALAFALDDLTPLGLPREEDLRRALVEPAAKYGVHFQDEALVEEILSELEGATGSLPLLCLAVAQLWERRDRERRVLTRAAYQSIGGMAGVLAQHAEATLKQFRHDEVPIVHELFRNLVTAQGDRVTRDRHDLLSVCQDRERASAVLDTLIAARLLTAYETPAAQQKRGLRHSVEITHRSLLTTWPRLVRWQAQDAEGALLRDQLRQAAHLWEERLRSDDLLWTGTAFREYRLWRERYAGRLTTAEEAFADAATRLAGRRRRRRRIATAAIIGGFSIAVGTLSILWGRAEAARAKAEAGKLIALGEREMESYPTGALAYAIKSLELADTEPGRLLAMRALQEAPMARIAPTGKGKAEGGWALSLDFSPSGQWVAWGGHSKAGAICRDGRRRLLLSGYRSERQESLGVRFSPGSDELAADLLGDVRIWSIPEGRELARGQLEEGPSTLATGNDGFVTLTTVARKAVIRAWPFGTGRSRRIGEMNALGPTEIRRDLLAFARGRQIFVRSLADWHSPPRLLAEDPADVLDLAFAPDGSRLAASDDSGGIQVWATSSQGEPPRVLDAKNTAWLRYDNSGRWLAARGSLKDHPVVRLWDLEAVWGARPIVLQRGDAVFVNEVSFGPQGRWLATAHADDVALWWIGRPRPRVLNATDKVMGLGFTPDGKTLVFALNDGTVRAWPLDGRLPVVLLRAHLRLRAIATEPSGRYVAVSGAHGQVRLTPLDGGPVRLLRGFSDKVDVAALAFGDGGRLLAAAPHIGPSDEKVLRVWNLATGAVKALGPVPGAGQGSVGGVETGLWFRGADKILASVSGAGLVSFNLKTGRVSSVAPSIHLASLDSTGISGVGLAATTADAGPESPRSRRSIRFRLDGSKLADLGWRGVQVTAATSFDRSGRLLAIGSRDGTVRVGLAFGTDPHLMLGHAGLVRCLAFSPDGRWLASGGDDGTIRLWPVPDMSKPPLHTLPLDTLLAKLRTHTNLRAVADPESITGYKLQPGPFPGWEHPPEW